MPWSKTKLQVKHAELLNLLQLPVTIPFAEANEQLLQAGEYTVARASNDLYWEEKRDLSNMTAIEYLLNFHRLTKTIFGAFSF